MATRHIAPRSEGGWQVTDPAGQEATERTSTQDEAILVAHHQLGYAGGGELVIHGADGRIRDKRTIPPGS